MKERLPRTFRSEAVQEWYHGLENAETPHSHFLLGALLTSTTFQGGLLWLRQNWAPFLNAADEIMACVAQEWGVFDGLLPADTDRYSALCQELARLCDRFVF